jgi:DNA-binding beta-propeller fold protein YncE
LYLEEAQSAGFGKRWGAAGIAVAVIAGLTALGGCGSAYRPVVATIGLIGPAGQPTKYAIAISSPTQTPGGPIAFTGAWSATTTYAINQGVNYLGSQYVSLQNGNVNKNPATATAYWSLLTDSLLTMVDFSGDTILATTAMGVDPYYLVLNSSGTIAFTLNSDDTVTSLQLSTSEISSQVLETTLLPGAAPVSLFATPSASFMADPGVNAIDQLTGTPAALKQELPIASGYSPIYVVGQASAPRLYSISQATGGGPGQAEAIETSTNTISNTIPVGRGPVYGVMTVDTRRAFVLNQTDGTVSVINTVSNQLDTPVSTITVGPRPVWADLASGLDELVVANEGNGTTPGSLSIINIPLCTSTTLPTNPNCVASNPVDATTFGQTVATVPVGINPIMVSVLSDFSRAYVANAGVLGLPCAAVSVAGVSTTCTVSVVNLVSDTVTATIPIQGHPAYIATSAGTPTGKVYVVCKDSQVMTVIETDTDSVDTTIPLQGYGVSVRMTAP